MNHDQARDVAVDVDGNVIVVGLVQGQIAQDVIKVGDMPKGGNDIFVVKLNPMGMVTWARLFGSASEDYANTVAVDGQGNIYVAGIAGPVDFGGGKVLDGVGGYNAFVAKLSPDGAVDWAKTYGGPGSEEITDLAVDASGNLFAAGRYTGLPVFGKPDQMPDSAASYNVLVAKIAGEDGSVAWAKGYGGSGANQEATSITVDGADIVVAADLRGALDWDPVSPEGLYASSGALDVDIAVAKLSGLDGAFVWGRAFRDPAASPGFPQHRARVKATAGGVVLVAAVTGDVESYMCAIPAGSTADLAVIWLAADNTTCLQVDRRDLPGDQAPSSIDVDEAGNLLVTGDFTQAFDWSSGVQPLQPPSPDSRFVLKLRLDASSNPPIDYLWQRAFPSVSQGPTSGAMAPLGGAVITGAIVTPVDLGGGTAGAVGNGWEIFVNGLAP